MGVLTRPKLYAQQRVDLEDFKVLFEALRTDSKYFMQKFWTPGQYILSGFVVSGLGGSNTATVTLADSTLVNASNTGCFSWWTAEDGASPLSVDLEPGQRNYLEIELIDETGTPLTRAFWDQTLFNGEGGEFNETVNTVEEVNVSVVVLTGGFSGSPDRIPLAVIDTNGSNTVQSILDRRDTFFRLGGVDDQEREYTWASRVEPGVQVNISSVVGTFEVGEVVNFTSGASAEIREDNGTNLIVTVLSNSSILPADTVTGVDSGATATVDTFISEFSGADLEITTLKDMLDALMTEIKLMKGTRFWYEAANMSNNGLSRQLHSVPVQAVVDAKYSWDGSELSITDDSGTPADADVLANLRLFGESSNLEWTRQDAASAPIPVAEGEILFIELPAEGEDRVYTGVGSSSTNYQTVAIEDYEKSDSHYWLAYRQLNRLYIRGYGELEAGEEVIISDPQKEDILAQIAANLEKANQDRTSKLIAGGTWSWNLASETLTWSADAFIQIAGLANDVNEINVGSVVLGAEEVAYVSLKRTAGASTLTVNTGTIDALTLDDNIFIFARRIGDDVLVGRSFLLKDEEYLELDGALAEINRYFGQFRVIPHESDAVKVRITGGDISKLNGTELSSAILNRLVAFDGAVIDFETGDVFESDGVTPLANSFTPATIAANQFRYYSITLTAGTINGDNTVGFEVNVEEAATDGPTAELAARASFIDGVGIGQVFVQEDGAGGILDIAYENITQLGVIGGAASSAVGGSVVKDEDVLLASNVSTFDFQGDGVELLDEGGGEVAIIIDSASDGRIINGFRAGEDFDVTGNGAPFAVFPKRKKLLVFDASNNVLETSEGTITIDAGTYIYPYTSLKSQMETKLNALGSVVFTVTLLEQHTKIEADAAFTINKLAANTATTKLGYVGLDTSTPSTFFRADANKDFTIDVLLYKTNTTNDATPPNLASDGVTPVAANWRSRSFSGFVQEDFSELDVVKLYVSGTMKGFSGLSEADNYYINGTAGQVSTASVANSLLIGEALADGDGLFLDAHNKDFELEIEPDTDFAFDTADGIFVWEELPEVPNFFESDVALHGADADGDNVVSAQVSTTSLGPMAISYSTDKGKSWKLAQLDGVTDAVNENLLNTRETSSWNNTTEYYGLSPKVLVVGDNVFVAYLYWDNTNTRHKIKGLFGRIDSNGNLALRQSNETSTEDIGVPGATVSYTSMSLQHQNGVIYISGVNVGFGIRFFTSRDMGATFPSGDSNDSNIRNGASTVDISVASFEDFIPHRTAVVDVPGQTIGTANNFTDDFSAGITGWTREGAAAGTISHDGVNELLTFTDTDGSSASANRIFTTEVGKAYTISVNIKDIRVLGTLNNNGLDVKIGDSAGGLTNGFMTTSLAYSSDSIIREGTHQFTFVANAVSTRFQLGSETSADTFEVDIDDFSVTEVPLNRVAVVTPAISNGVGTQRNNLFYTDDQDLDANWASAIDLTEDLGATFHVPVGAHLDLDNSLWYIQSIAGHATNNGSGATARTGNTDESAVYEIDLSAATPSIQKGLVNWDPNSSSQITPDYGEGTNNTNMRSYFVNPKNIYKNDAGVFAAASLESGAPFIALITDMSDVANTTEVINYTNYLFNNTGGSSVIVEGTFVEVASGFNFIYKRGFNSFGTLENLGKVVSATLTVDTGAKTELITNGTFDTDISGWNEDQATISFNSNRLRAVSGGATTATASQTFATVPGKLYNYTVDVINQVGTADVIIRDVTGQAIDVRSGLTTGTYVGSFRAISDQSKIDLGTTTISQTQDFDNVSIMEASVQADYEVDIIDKPNVDEQGFAGRIQAAVSDGTMHIFAEKELDVDDSTAIENVVYNNFGLKNINLFTSWQSSPLELFDAQAADATQFEFSYDPQNPLIGMAIVKRSGVNTWSVWTTGDGGDSWQFHSNFFVSSGQNYDNDNDAYAFQADIDIYEGKFCIAIPVEVGGTHTESRTYYGELDTTTGEVLSIAESSYFAGSTLENAGAAAGSQLQFQRSPDGSALFVMAFRTSNGNLIINRSDDDGASWTSQGAVKSGASAVAFRYSSGTAYSPSIMHVIEDPDTPNNWRVIVSGTNQAGNSRVSIHYTDDQDLSNNWETAVDLADLSAVTVDFITGAELSPDQSQLALVTRSLNASATNTFLTIADVGSTTITLSQNSVNTGVSHGGSDTFNGNNSDNAEGGNFTRNIQRRRVIWEGETALLYVANGDVNGVGDVQIVKIADVTNIAATATTTRFKAAATAGDYRATEGQIFKLDNGEYWAVCKVANATQANWQDIGRIHAKQFFNPNPTVDEAITINQGADVSATDDNVSINLANKASAGAPFAGRIIAKKYGDALRVGWEMDNTLGFEGVFMNNYQSRQFNPEVEEWRQVPVQTPAQSTDVAVWGFDRSGDDIILAVGRNSATAIEFKASTDGGKNWYSASSVNGNLAFNNDGNYLGFNPKVKIDGDEAVVLYSEVSGNDVRAVKFSKSGNVWATISDVIAINGSAGDEQDIGLAYDPVNGKLYTGGREGLSTTYTINSSSDLGATWGTPSTVKDGVSLASVQSLTPLAMSAFDLGAGNTRLIVVGKDGGNNIAVWYTDDDGATWGTKITGPSVGVAGNRSLYGIKSFGNKLAVLVFGDGAPNSLYLSVCDDITDVTPSFSATVDISDGAGAIDLFGGRNASDSNSLNMIEHLNKIQWLSGTSLVCTFDRSSAGQSSVAVLVPDTSALGTNTLITMFQSDGSIGYQETQIVKSNSNQLYTVTKASSLLTSNLSRGRILSREIQVDGSSVSPGQIEDIIYKSSETTGGFAGRIQLCSSSQDSIMFEKEDGSSIEQLYFNSIENRRVQKGD